MVGASSGKVQHIPPSPAPCLSWARLWWKARDKTWRENPFSSRPCCSVSHSKGCFTLYISLCVHRVWTIGRFGHDTSLFSVWCCSEGVKEIVKPGQYLIRHLYSVEHRKVCEMKQSFLVQSTSHPVSSLPVSMGSDIQEQWEGNKSAVCLCHWLELQMLN